VADSLPGDTGISDLGKWVEVFEYLLENPGIPLPFRIQTNSLKALDLEFKVLDEII
jgi:hypothetical protein